jgi:hypothetical protein
MFEMSPTNFAVAPGGFPVLFRQMSRCVASQFTTENIDGR